MELVEPIEEINQFLIREYGLWTDGRPRFRMVWSEDQFEKRSTKYTDEGYELLFPEVRLLPKYNYVEGRYILEQLSLVPPNEMVHDKLVESTSYEPLWTFENQQTKEYIPPRIIACKLLIEIMYKNVHQAGNGVKYKDKDAALKARQEYDAAYEALFGNDTPVTDALALKTGVVVPGNTQGE